MFFSYFCVKRKHKIGKGGTLFQFFASLQKEFKLPKEIFGKYNIVMISSNFLYLEGHKGILKLSEENITFRVPSGVIVITGTNLLIKELTKSTASITGNIKHFEVL